MDCFSWHFYPGAVAIACLDSSRWLLELVQVPQGSKINNTTCCVSWGDRITRQSQISRAKTREKSCSGHDAQEALIPCLLLRRLSTSAPARVNCYPKRDATTIYPHTNISIDAHENKNQARLLFSSYNCRSLLAHGLESTRKGSVGRAAARKCGMPRVRSTFFPYFTS